MAKFKFILILLVLVLTGCAHEPGGFMVRRADTNYELFVGGAVADMENSFYMGAFEICRKNHKSGFEISNRSSDKYGSIKASIICKGPIDQFLLNKFKGTTIELEASETLFKDGYRYRLVTTAN